MVNITSQTADIKNETELPFPHFFFYIFFSKDTSAKLSYVGSSCK